MVADAAGDHGEIKDDGSTHSESLSSLALAQEIGLNAHEYLEECFYTEAPVLDRGKFNAIPEIIKTEFTVMVSELEGLRRV